MKTIQEGKKILIKCFLRIELPIYKILGEPCRQTLFCQITYFSFQGMENSLRPIHKRIAYNIKIG